MKKIILIFLLLSFYTNSNSQSPKIDSLKNLLKKNNPDSIHVKLLKNLSFEYVNYMPDSAILIAQEGLAIAKRIDFRRAEPALLNVMGLAYRTIGNYPKALEIHLEALKINERMKNMNGMSVAYNNIGIIYKKVGDFRKALDCYFKAKKIAEDINSQEDILNNFINIGSAYIYLNQLDSARLFTQQAYELALKLKDDYRISEALNNLGDVFMKMNNSDISLSFYKSALPYYEKEKNYEGLAGCLLNMAKIFKIKNESDSSLIYTMLSLIKAQKSGFTEQIFSTSEFLSQYYAEHNIIDSAFKYFKIASVAKDSLFNKERTEQLQNLSFNERIRQQEIIAEKIEKEKERKNNLQLIGIALFIVIFISFVLIFSRRKTNPKSIEILGLVALLLVFEFISLLIDPYIGRLTHHSPIFMMLILVSMAAVLGRLHHKIEEWIKKKVANKIIKSRKHPSNLKKKRLSK